MFDLFEFVMFNDDKFDSLIVPICIVREIKIKQEFCLKISFNHLSIKSFLKLYICTLLFYSDYIVVSPIGFSHLKIEFLKNLKHFSIRDFLI